jgi:hypothetical protein
MSTPVNKKYKEIIREEYLKCATDPVYFMKRYCYIQHPMRGKILFKLYPYQEEVLHNFQNNKFNIVLKSRQLGISTLSSGFSIWTMLFHTDKNILVIATKQDVAKNIITKVTLMYDMLPSWLRIGIVEKNKLTLRLSNGSQIKAVAASPDAGRSEGCSLLILDEAAFISDIEQIWTSASQTLNTGGGAIVLSTPNGMNWFYDMYSKAENGDDDGHKMVPIRLDWTVHPERDITWRQEQERLLGHKMAAQECDAEFTTSGDTVIDVDILNFYRDTYIREPMEKEKGGHLWIWAKPDYTRRYLLCADVARGDGADYSTFHVFDVETLEQVAEYQNKIGTTEFGHLIVSVASDYNDAVVVVENASVGWAVIQTIIDKQYRNLFYSTSDLKYVDVEHQFTNKVYANDKKMVPGLITSPKSRPLMINKMEMYFRERSAIIHSHRLYKELTTFIWENGKAQAMKGKNDDLVLALCFFLWVRDTSLKLLDQKIQLNKQMLDNFTVNRQDNAGTGLYTPNDLGIGNPWEMPIDVFGNKEKLDWLL